ncbi:MAG: metal-dependent hydrolase [Bacteroidetes bacterium]|jgi:inner membrane protein|nr:metal-dependent hydrolase [Bacteroidota bacterium]
MDSITQITLGAALGEALLGKKIGYRAAAWGALLGTTPDLDILANPFLDNVAEISFHRGFTHSVLFCLFASPMFGFAINYLQKKWEVGWKKWTQFAFLVFFTHIILDVQTTYGTQVFYFFSDRPVTTDSIFIIDPVYTFTLLFGLISALFLNRQSKIRSLMNKGGLLISTLYLIWALGIKAHVHSVFDASFENQYGFYERIKTTPNGPSTFLWTGYVIREDTVYQSIYSIYDKDANLQFRAIPRNTELIGEIKDDRAVETLLWFSRGYYTIENKRDSLMFYDLRFGRSDLWLTRNEEVPFVWQNQILFDENGNATNIKQQTPSFETRSSIFSRFIDRIKGE